MRNRYRPTVEILDTKMLFSAPVEGTDYVLEGDQWANKTVTYSFAPDGTEWDHGINNLNATFDAKVGASADWEWAIAHALDSWGAVSGLNFVRVEDGGEPSGTAGAPQGDPRFGDIRFGGYPFADGSNQLAVTYYPNSQLTIGGDVEINTAMAFSLGGGGNASDLYSVMLHETGHALGLDHAPNPAEIMFANYHGPSTLAPGDIAGIQKLYGMPAVAAAPPTPPPTPAPPVVSFPTATLPVVAIPTPDPTPSPVPPTIAPTAPQGSPTAPCPGRPRWRWLRIGHHWVRVRLTFWNRNQFR